MVGVKVGDLPRHGEAAAGSVERCNSGRTLEHGGIARANATRTPFVRGRSDGAGLDEFTPSPHGQARAPCYVAVREQALGIPTKRNIESHALLIPSRRVDVN